MTLHALARRFPGAGLLACVVILSASVTSAQQDHAQRTVAQALFDEARRLMAEAHYQEACTKLEESERLDPGVGTEFNLAVCYEATGRTASAWSLFLEVAAQANRAAERAREQAARARAAALEPRLSRLRIVVPEAARADGLSVERNSIPVGPGQWGMALPADPGTYTITARAPGKLPWQVTVTVTADAQTRTVAITPPATQAGEVGQKAARASQDHGTWFERLGTQRTVGLAFGAGAVLALGTGTVFGVLAIREANRSDDGCKDDSCNPAGFERRNAALAHGDRATVAFIAGGVLAAAGTLLFLTGESEQPARVMGLRVLPDITPEGAGVLATATF
jgi:hypothetical protein